MNDAAEGTRLYEHDRRLTSKCGRTAYSKASQDKGYEPRELVERVAASKTQLAIHQKERKATY